MEIFQIKKKKNKNLNILYLKFDYKIISFI